MGKHLKDNEIDNLVSGITDTAGAKVAEEHLKGCKLCSEKIRILSEAVNGSEPVTSPRPYVKDAIITEWHKINSESTVSVKWYSIPLKTAVGFAAAVFVAVTVYLGINGITSIKPVREFSVAEISGVVLLNSKSAGTGDAIQEGDTVVTLDRASVNIKSENFDLMIKGPAEIKLGANKRGGFNFTLYRGSVVSKSYSRLSYSFTCGDYSVTPSGTEFRIDYLDRNLRVIVLSGEVTVSGSGVNIRILSGMVWSSDNKNIINYNLHSTELKGRRNERVVSSEQPDKREEKIPEKSIYEKNGDTDKSDIRDLKREARKEMNELKKESKRGKQRGGD